MAGARVPTTVIGTASRGCCPVCRELCPRNEDGWHECRDCLWDFQVETRPDGHTYMICRQPGPVVASIKARAIIGLLGMRNEDGSLPGQG